MDQNAELILESLKAEANDYLIRIKNELHESEIKKSLIEAVEKINDLFIEKELVIEKTEVTI